MHEKKPARKFRLIDGQTGPKMAKLHEKRTIFAVFELHICCGRERFCCTANTKERTNGPATVPHPGTMGSTGAAARSARRSRFACRSNGAPLRQKKTGKAAALPDLQI